MCLCTRLLKHTNTHMSAIWHKQRMCVLRTHTHTMQLQSIPLQTIPLHAQGAWLYVQQLSCVPKCAWWKWCEIPNMTVPHPLQGEGVCCCMQCEVRVLLMEGLCFNSYNMQWARNVVPAVLAYPSTYLRGRVSVDPVWHDYTVVGTLCYVCSQL